MLFDHANLSSQDKVQVVALSDTRQERTWLELEQKVLKLREFLLSEKCLQENQHIALLIGNRVEFIELMLAGTCSGLWVTPINTHLSQDEREYIASDCDATLLFYDQDHSDIAELDLPCECIAIEDLEKALSNIEAKAMPEDAGAGGTMLYTSGTTGRPKGVRRNKAAKLSTALQQMSAGAKGFGLQGLGPHLVTGPLYHAAPMLFALYDMINGAPVIIMPKWDNARFIELVNEHQVHTSHLVPTMFVRLLAHQEKETVHAEQLSSLKLVLHGAAPIAPSVKKKMIDWWGPILLEYWGASEAGTSTLVNSEDWLKRPGTVGKALAHLKIFVGDKNGNPSGEKQGLLFCEHRDLKQVFEYHKDPEKTRKAHPKDHIFCIGDIGHVDEDGYVFLSDRESNMIISGGVNIYPAEIEQVLIEHPDIMDLVIYGIEDPEWGEQVKALIELSPSAKLSQQEGQRSQDDIVSTIKEFASKKIAKYKIPREFEFTEALPRNAAGKVRVKDLK